MMKKIKRILFLLLSLLLLFIVYSMISHQYKKPTTTFSHTLKVLTYNTQALCLGKKNTAKQMLAYLCESDADVLCLQEVKVYKKAPHITLPELREAMRKYPYTYYDFKLYNSKRQFGNVIFSKYPLTNKHTVQYESNNNISSCCDISIGKDTIRLIVNHLESYHLQKGDLMIDTIIGSQLKNSPLKQKMDAADRLRHAQANAVKDEINQSPHPVIVVGDFNAIPLSYVYWKIRWGLRDCFLEGSFGKLGNTYKKGPFGIRIDYILCSKKFTPIKCEVDKVQYSDHFPMIATISW